RAIPASKMKGTYQRGTAGASIPADRKTVRDGVTRTVLPYDGSALGAKQVSGATSKSTGDQVICATQNVTLTAGFNELNLLDPTAVEIWPGRLIRISSIDDGSYAGFTGFDARNDMTIALIAAGTSRGNVTRAIPAAGQGITQGTVVNAINGLKNNFGQNDFGSDSWAYDLFQFSSSTQFLLEAGAGVSAVPINLDIRANSSINTSVKKNKIVLRFIREAYDIKVDSPLDDLVTGAAISDDAGVVANVTYGQFAIVEIESDSSFASMEAALNFSITPDPSATISGNLRTRLQNTVQSFSIKAILKGIGGNEEIRTVPSINDLKSMLSGATAFSATTPVVPVSFVVKSVKTGETMMLKSGMSYNKRECTSIPDGENIALSIKLVALTAPKVSDGFSDDEDIYGTIAMATVVPGQNPSFNTVWEKSVTNNVKVKKSILPSEAGAYNMNGDAETIEIRLPSAASDLQRQRLAVRVRLRDEEMIDVRYGERTLEIPYSDLLRSLSSDSNSSIDNYDNGGRAFFVEVVEVGSTNKIRVWFKAQKVVL
ncbi:MAG: hypothetical protein JWP27_760, partial [Flaviaesturariibacter sp.]|nr:hypothetical protein [Flaviaesturariibacter sp.]